MGTPEAEQPSAVIKSCAEDFFVEEMLDIPFTGCGEHAWFYVEKRGWNSQDVARELAAAYCVPEVAVGYAGRKDKHAVTRQWFSVCTGQDRWLPQLPNLRCLATARHERKLRRGQHQGNRFRIVLREAAGCSVPALQQLSCGFANGFGPQRVSADNVAQAQRWLLQRPRRSRARHISKQHLSKQRLSEQQLSEQKRGWHLSVLRSYLFNCVLAARRAAANHNCLIDGDVVEDGLPTAPLWGRGRSATQGAALLVEQQALAEHAQLCEALEFCGVDQARRKLWEQPIGLQVAALDKHQFVLEFALRPGVYATSMLSACVRLETA